jgi:hypothetical protein
MWWRQSSAKENGENEIGIIAQSHQQQWRSENISVGVKIKHLAAARRRRLAAAAALKYQRKPARASASGVNSVK